MPSLSRLLLSGLAASLLGSALLAGDTTVDELGVLPGDAAAVAAANNQDQVAIAAGDDGFLVAWTDRRTASATEQNGRDIYAARLDVAGNLLDTTPIIVHQTFGAQEAPQVAWNGSHWLVAWRSQEPTQFFYGTAFRAARVAPDGTVLDDPPILLHAFTSSSSVMSTLTSNGSEWLLVFQGTSVGEGGLQAVRVGADGSLLDPAPVMLVPPTYFLFFNLEVVSAGGEYLLSWDEISVRVSQRFSAALTPLSAKFNTPVRLTGSNGTGYMGIWSAGGNVVASRMALDGTLLDPGGVPIAPAASANFSSGVSVSWDGTVWWVSYDHFFTGLLAARIAADGTVLDPGGVPLDAAFEDDQGAHESAARPGGGLQVAWTDYREPGLDPYDVRALQVSAAAVPGPSAPISLGAPSQVRPDIAAGGSGALVVFRSERSGGDRILAQRIDGSGMALDAEPLELSDTLYSGSPSVAWNGALWLVVWTQGGDVVGRRVLPDGTLLDAGLPVLMPDGVSPDVAAVGTVFLVVGTRPTISTQFYHPFSVRVDGATGAVLDTPVQLGQYFARVPHVIAFGGRWLATWQRNFSHDDPGALVQTAFIEPDGTTAGEFTVEFGGQPDVAATDDDGTALIVWRTGTDSSSNPDLRARRMAPDGSFLDASFPLATAANKQLHPAVIWTGTEFLVAWDDLRNASSFFDERTDVFAARVAEDGTVLDPSAFPLAAGVDPEQRPCLAQVAGTTIAASSDYLVQAPYAAYRIALRTVGATSAWAPLGDGLAGTAGVPLLVGTGDLVGGSGTSLELTGALPNGTTSLILGLSELSAPFKGGTLVPSPDVILVGLPLSPSGSLLVGFPWPTGLPSGLATYWQHWIQDPAGVFGWSASNGLVGTTP